MKKTLIIILTVLLAFSFMSCDDEAPTPEEGKKTRIGEKYYNSLVEAVDDAKDGDTIILLQDFSGGGVKFESNKFNDEGLTIDLNNKVYTVIDPTVGSSGTETSGFQLLKDNKITFKNGTVNAGTDNAKILFQNYCDLTLDNVVANGGTTTQYVSSNNFGNTVYKNGTELNAEEGQVAFDVWYGMSSTYDAGVSVTIEDDSVVINGKVEFGKDSRADENDFISKAVLKVPVGYEITPVDPTSKVAYEYSFDAEGKIVISKISQ